MNCARLFLLALLASTTTIPIHNSFAGEAARRPMTSPSLQLPDEGALPSLAGATLWLNSAPLTPASLRGKVVLVDFSTYTCINWLRTLPYVRAWAEKYKDQGLVVINVQTPEFEFEKNIENVRWASKEMRVTYPTAVDNDYAIWNAFNNHYWPALYIVDAKGRIRHHQFGEGGYEQSERIIKQLLLEAGKSGVGSRARNGGCARPGGRGRLGQPAIAGELRRLRSRRELLLAGRRGRGQGARVCDSVATQAQPLGARRRLDRTEAGHGVECGERATRLPLSCPGRASRDGAARRAEARCVFAYSSTANRPVQRTESTSTRREMAQCANNACISSYGSPRR